jgi:hypothetical protein
MTQLISTFRKLRRHVFNRCRSFWNTINHTTDNYVKVIQWQHNACYFIKLTSFILSLTIFQLGKNNFDQGSSGGLKSVLAAGV